MTKQKRCKRYSPEFKREALKRASEEGVRDVIEHVLVGNSSILPDISAYDLQPKHQ